MLKEGLKGIVYIPVILALGKLRQKDHHALLSSWGYSKNLSQKNRKMKKAKCTAVVQKDVFREQRRPKKNVGTSIRC